MRRLLLLADLADLLGPALFDRLLDRRRRLGGQPGGHGAGRSSGRRDARRRRDLYEHEQLRHVQAQLAVRRHGKLDGVGVPGKQLTKYTARRLPDPD